MAFLVFFILLGFLFYREIICLIVSIVSEAEILPEGPFDIRFSAKSKLKLKIYRMKVSPLECLSIDTLFHHIVFVSEKLWSDWNNEEREAYLEWTYSTRLRTSVILRLFGGFDPRASDRDSALTSSHPLSFAPCVEKAAKVRSKIKMSLLGGWLTGLSLLGPSIFAEWPDLDSRLKAFAFNLAKLT